jgi:hypothetical protein
MGGFTPATLAEYVREGCQASGDPQKWLRFKTVAGSRFTWCYQASAAVRAWTECKL